MSLFGYATTIYDAVIRAKKAQWTEYRAAIHGGCDHEIAFDGQGLGDVILTDESDGSGSTIFKAF